MTLFLQGHFIRKVYQILQFHGHILALDIFQWLLLLSQGMLQWTSPMFLLYSLIKFMPVAFYYNTLGLLSPSMGQARNGELNLQGAALTQAWLILKDKYPNLPNLSGLINPSVFYM